MNRGRKTFLLVPVAAVLGVALLVLAVALTGQELGMSRAIRSCIQSGGTFLAVGVLALVAGLVIVAWGLGLSIRPHRKSGSGQ
jgi:signal transduction histidine kinase